MNDDDKIFVNHSNWMAKYYDIIYRQPINKLYLPGVDNAGMYNIDFSKIHQNASKTTRMLYKLSKYKIIKNYIESWYLRNRGDIRAQLMHGIRYLDFQYSIIDGEYCFSNTYIGALVKEGLTDIYDFLTDNRYEVVILNLRPDPEYLQYIDNKDVIKLYKMIKTELSELLYPRSNDLSMPVYYDMVQKNQRVMLFMDYPDQGIFVDKKYTWYIHSITAPDIQTINCYTKIRHIKDTIKTQMINNDNLNIIKPIIHPSTAILMKGFIYAIKLNKLRRRNFHYYNNFIQDEVIFLIDQPAYMKHVSIISFNYPTYTYINHIIKLNKSKLYKKS